MKNMSKAFFILNIRIRRSRDKELLAIDQFIYIEKFLRIYEMKEFHSMTTFIDDYHSLTLSEKNEARIDQKEYQKRIESLMYVMMTIRSNIAYAVGKLNQYCQNSIIRHRTILNRIFRYLRETIDLILLFDNSINSICYADVFYGDDVGDKKSTYENTLLIGNAAVTWASKKQRTIVSFITEAEYVSMCQTSKNIV